MSDSIKFGPEWLRNMSNDTGSLSSSTATSSSAGGGGGGLSYTNNQSTRFPLAEYRYGREEMLSLYDKTFKLPELLPKFNKLFIEKMQCPLALLPPTADEETPRGLTPIGGIASERSGLGLSSNNSSGSALSGINSSLGRGIRGSSIDRGRGRAPRGGLYHPSLGNYQRTGFLYEEDTRGIGARGDRTWTERNGTEADWNTTANGSPSPRKDFTALRSGTSGESWRRSRVEDDGQLLNGTGSEGWRTATTSAPTNTMYKWPVRSTSWRGGENEQGGGAFNADGTGGGGPPRLERSKSTQGSLPNREGDSALGPKRRLIGANASWDEDNLPEWAMDEPIEGGGSFDATGAFLGADDRFMGERVRVSDTSQTNAQLQSNEIGDQKLDRPKSSDGTADKENSLNDGSENMRTNENDDMVKSFNDASSDEPSANKKEKESKRSEGKATNEEKISTHKQISPGSSYKNTSNYSGSESKESAVATVTERPNIMPHQMPIDRLQEVAEDIEKLIMDDDQSCNDGDETLLTPHLHGRDSHKHSSAEDVLAEKTKAEMERWYYRDPQGKVQGPFTATEMLEWYRAGYFDETLNVRRVCDPQFIELGELLKACSGSIPFVSMPPIIPPLLQSNANEINLNTTPNVVKPSTPTKPLANHLVHPAKMPPPTSANNPPYFDILQSQNFLGLMNQPSNDFLLANSLPKHQNQPINTLPNVNALNKQTHLKNQHQTQSLQHLLSQHKNEFNAPDQVDPMHHMLNSINHQQISPPVGILPSVPTVPTIPPQTTSQNNSFQSLMMQLQMQKPHIMQQQIQQHHQQSIIMNAMNSSNMPPLPHHSIDDIQHQPAGIWDLPMPPAGLSNPPVVPNSSMKTEMQILEHLQAQAQAKAKEDQFKFEHLSAQQMDQWKKQQQALHQPQPPQMQHHPDIQQKITASPLVLGNSTSELLQPTDMFRPKIDNVKELEAHRAGVKAAKSKPDPSIGGVKPATVDMKSIQNFNKINNNSIEIQHDELHAEKIDIKSNKSKNVAAAATSLIVNATKQPIEMKTNQKTISGPTASDVANKSNNNVAIATAPKNPIKESTKKKSKEKDQKAAEEKRRQQEEDEEKRRQELIAAQRRAKLVDQNAVRPEQQQQTKRNNLAASVAPWSNLAENSAVNTSNSALTLAEIQKAERERRSELFRIEQANQQTQALLDQQQQKESVLKWKLKPQNQAKSLAEIQAEESKARQTIQQLSAASAAQQKQQNAKKDDKWPISTWSMIWGNEQANNSGGGGGSGMNALMQSGNGNPNCFWEDTAKAATSTKGNVQQNGTGKPLAKSQTVSNMQTAANNAKANASKLSTTISKTNSTGNVTSVINSTSNNNNKKVKGSSSSSKKDGDDEFGAWCAKALSAHNDVIDVPTFVSFLRDIESPFEVKDYIRMYLGETKECAEFAKHFLERRSKYKNQQRAANAHIDDMCSPAPAITPASLQGIANDGQEAKGKVKKEKKKNKMTKLDSRILGFSVTSAEDRFNVEKSDRINVGAREYARDGP